MQFGPSSVIFAIMYNFLKGHLKVVRLCLVAATLALIAIGIASIYSVGHPAEPSPASQTADLTYFWKKQVIFALIAVLTVDINRPHTLQMILLTFFHTIYRG